MIGKIRKDGTHRFEPFGQPTKYDSKYCLLLMEAMHNGNTVTQFCRDNYIPSTNFYVWIKRHPEFGQAYKDSADYSKAHDISFAEENYFNKDFNTGLFKFVFGTKHGFPENTANKIEVNHTMESQDLDDIIKIKNKHTKEY